MEQTDSANSSVKTYSYKGENAGNKKILILYNESINDTNTPSGKYKNHLYIEKNGIDVEISTYDGEVELF